MREAAGAGGDLVVPAELDDRDERGVPHALGVVAPVVRAVVDGAAEPAEESLLPSLVETVADPCLVIKFGHETVGDGEECPVALRGPRPVDDTVVGLAAVEPLHGAVDLAHPAVEEVLPAVSAGDDAEDRR